MFGWLAQLADLERAEMFRVFNMGIGLVLICRPAARDGLLVRDVLVADASRRTTGLNAYVSGLGATRRIVVYDTLLGEAPPGQVRSVVAHELGHAKDHDPELGTLLRALGAAATVVGPSSERAPSVGSTSPKSATRTRPSSPMRTFAGLKSRCTRPAA